MRKKLSSFPHVRPCALHLKQAICYHSGNQGQSLLGVDVSSVFVFPFPAFLSAEFIYLFPRYSSGPSTSFARALLRSLAPLPFVFLRYSYQRDSVPRASFALPALRSSFFRPPRAPTFRLFCFPSALFVRVGSASPHVVAPFLQRAAFRAAQSCFSFAFSASFLPRGVPSIGTWSCAVIFSWFHRG